MTYLGLCFPGSFKHMVILTLLDVVLQCITACRLHGSASNSSFLASGLADLPADRDAVQCWMMCTAFFEKGF